MKTYNFKAQFSGPVQRGEKTSTIRANGKRQPPRLGEALRFYTGMRTKQCKFLRDAVCESCTSIRITGLFITLGGRLLARVESDLIAQRDGFKNTEEMVGFFQDTHGPRFEGWLITWRNQ